MNSLRKSPLRNTAVGIAFLSLSLYIHVNAEAICVLLCYLLALVLFGRLVYAALVGYFTWRRQSQWWFIPALVCLAFLAGFIVTPSIGKRVSDAQFKRHLPEYTKALQDVRNATNPCAATCDIDLNAIPEGDRPRNVGALFASRCDDGGLSATFVDTSDVPLVHTGYLFKGYGENSSCSRGSMAPEHSLYLRHIAGQWYHFSDQPDL